ncbi:MAG: DsrE/DsrF/DrsH-like family protein [Oscillospiraceae bacterium]
MASENKRTVTPQQIAGVNAQAASLVDLREPDEFIIGTIPGAVNIPFSRFATEIYTLPQEKPVYLFCRTGDWSGEVLEILLDAGYNAYELEGGYAAYRSSGPVPQQPAPAPQSAPPAAAAAEMQVIDATGLKCPGPIVKVADELRALPVGTRVLAKATEDAFFSDIRVWCERTGNKLVSLSAENGAIQAVIEKSEAAAPAAAAPAGNDKTMVVFSGDLDKTIAAFIIANGAAAMGRRVTLFFTFWGLNILRRPKKVSVAKSLIEKMFGFMMPRGSKKLGLSRMNMAGIGPKMIRGIMKSKNIFSLEELMQQALDHGVRLVACQMSMDIMGIHKEELIEGIELGGVSTFIGAGELSDMSLFI